MIMKAANLTRKQMEREIRKSRKKLKQEAVKIREMLASYGMSGADAPLIAIKRFEAMKVPYQFRRKGIEYYTDKEVLAMYRDLEYIKQLKTATVEGAMEAMDNFGEIASYLSSKSEAEREHFWEIYDKVYESVKDRFKYEAMQLVADMQESGRTTEEIIKTISEPAEKILMQYGKDLPDEQFDLLYSEELHQLREGYNFFDPWSD